jgi:tagatose 6-phosphate kinase
MAYTLTVGLNPALQKVLAFDRYRPDAVNRASAASHLASGKGINVSRTLILLGKQSVCTGVLGGPNGALIEEELKREGLHSAFTAIASGTRQCLTIEDRQRGTTTELIEPSPNVTTAEVDRWVHAYESLVPWSEFVTISGTMPTGFPNNLYKKLINYARKKEKRVLVDCGGSPFMESASAEPEVLKCNEEELCAAIQVNHLNNTDLVKNAERFLKGNTSWVIITRGHEPALFVTRNSVYWATPPKIQAVNPIGSGDCVSAGIVIGLLDGLDEEGIIKMGIACGTANALISGPGIVKPADIKRLQGEVQIKTKKRSE